jgi:hypothetical protein
VQIDFDEWRRAEAEAAQVRGKHFSEWTGEIAQLKRDGRLAEALVLIYECIDATERADKVTGNGCPAPAYYEKAAVIHRQQKDFDAEIQVLDRYLRAASSVPSARSRVENRHRKTWRRRYGTEDAPVPPPLTPQGALSHRLAAAEDAQRREAEKQAREFLDADVLDDDDDEGERRSRAGLPGFLLDKVRWRPSALRLAGTDPDRSQLSTPCWTVPTAGVS